MTTASYIDIHCHLLPGVDDGPATLALSLDMARQLADGGVAHVFATPHHICGTAWSHPADDIRLQVKDLQAAVDQHNIALNVLSGMEIALHHHLMQEFERTELLPLGASNLYLLEPPFHQFNENLLDVVFSFKKSGKDVILAHPERIPFFQKNTAQLLQLTDQGILVQANIGSLLGEFGKASKKTARYLVKHDALHFVASDSHSPENRNPPNRDQWLQLEHVLGVELTRRVCIENPTRLLGAPVEESTVPTGNDLPCDANTSESTIKSMNTLYE